MSSFIESLANQFISPSKGSLSQNALGPWVITTPQGIVTRKDTNINGIPTCIFTPLNTKVPITTTVVYCHSYNSNRAEALALVNHLHEANINLISFDFLRTQNGEINTHGIISFGMYEPKQVATIIDWAMKTFETKVIIWGRSMGAFVALRYQIEFGKASGLILDSSYISLQELIVKKFCQKSHLPEFVIREALKMWQSRVNEILGFDIKQLNVAEQLDKCKVPVVFVCSHADRLCGEATETLYDRYQGRKNLLYTDKKHDEAREQSIIKQCLKLISRMVRVVQPKSKKTLQRKDSERLLTCTSMHQLNCKSHIDISNITKRQQRNPSIERQTRLWKGANKH